MVRIIKPCDCEDDFVIYFRECSIVPLVGAGISSGTRTKRGMVPNGEQLKKHMIETIKESVKISDIEKERLDKMSFSQVSGLYDDDEIVDADVRREYLLKNLYQAEYQNDDYRCAFFDIGWPYIYSLNIDDAIERYADYTEILPSRDYNLDMLDKTRCLFKLHGDIKDIVVYKQSYKVFTSKEYVSSLMDNRPMLNKLATDYGNINMLFLGCSLLDEIDILALDSIRTLNAKRDLQLTTGNDGISNKKNYFFTTEEPSVIERSQYNLIGITDVVVFDDYPDMYAFLKRAWDESLKTPIDALDDYARFKAKELNSQNPDNREFFYCALNPINYDDKSIIFPYYYVRRDGMESVLRRIDEHKIQIISGSRFSGKTYALIDIYRSINRFSKYIFDARTKLTDAALESIIDKKKCMVIFDAGVLNRNQFEYILSQHKRLLENENSIIVMLHGNDSEMIGIIKMLEQQRVIDKDDYYSYLDMIKNRFNKNEANRVNQLLSEVRLLPYSQDDTLINHLMNAAGEAKTNSKYSGIQIPCENVKAIALSIALASNEVLLYSDIVSLELEDTIVKALEKCDPLIEQLNTNRIEKSPRDMSGKKYVLNSKYWMRNGLIDLADNNRIDAILEAYRYLIERLIDYSRENLNRRREKYRKIIYFDTINDIFGGRHGGRRDFAAKIYTNLNDLLGTDYQYNHQMAKCLMRDAFYQKKDATKEQSYIVAKDSALIAKRQVENEYNQHQNEKLLISLAHIEYTLASIMASICDLHSYSDIPEVEQTIQACYNAAINPYNADEFEKEKKKNSKYGILFFIKSMTRNEILQKVSNVGKRRYDELLARSFAGYHL